MKLFAEVRDERMQRRLFTERSHAESRAVTPPALRAFAASQRDARALHEAGGKLKKVTRIVEAARLQRECCNREADPALPPVYAPLTRTASFLRA